MSAPIQADAVNDWFRHVGTSMNNEDYEAGIKVIADLVDLNRRLANQVVGITDRVNESIGGIMKAAKVGALREAVSDFESNVGVGEFADQSKRGPMPWGHIEESWEHQGPYMDWLRNRADQLEES